jgi:hypothetical protein
MEKRIVISKAVKRKKGILTEMVVYHTTVGKRKYSRTKHEAVK